MLAQLNFKKNIKLVGLIILLIVLLFSPNITKAGWIEDALSNVVIGVFRLIAYILNSIGGLLFMLANYLVQFFLGLNYTVLSSSNALVYVGWSIVRDIANLGFVLAIIIIALATTLRFKEYAAQKLLPKLIAAAILVNFTLTIASVFINFSNVLTNFFFNRIDPNPITLTNQLADAFGPQRFLLGEENPLPVNPEEETSGLTQFGTAVITSILGLIFTVIFTFIAALVMLLYAILLLLRYLWLSFLLVIAPIVWLFWVIPALAHHFKEWWDKFFKWVFFAPASAFFMYLTLVSVQELGKQKPAFTAAAASFLGIGSLVQNVLINGAQMIVIAGIMIGGLIVAEKIGIEGAKTMTGIAKKVGEGARKGLSSYGKQRLARTGAATLTSGPGQAAASAVRGGLGGLGMRMRNFGARGNWLTRTITAPVRGVGRGLITTAQGVKRLTPKAQAVLAKPKPSLLGSIFKSVSGEFGIKQWQCNSCGNVYGPSKKPPDKCTNPGCPVNTPGGPKQSWKGL